MGGKRAWDRSGRVVWRGTVGRRTVGHRTVGHRFSGAWGRCGDGALDRLHRIASLREPSLLQVLVVQPAEAVKVGLRHRQALPLYTIDRSGKR